MTIQQGTDKRGAAFDLIANVAQAPERAGQIALEFLLEQVENGELSQEALQELRDAIPDTTPENDVDLNAQKQAFIDKYGIEVLAESQVALTLPEGATRIEFLQEAQEIAKKLHGQDGIWPGRLERWTKDRAFTDTVDEIRELAVDGNVKGSTNHTRSEQEKKGWNDVDFQDLAVAHAAYFIATGKDLFAGNIVRARGGALFFSSLGLGVDGYSYGDLRYDNVSASRALPSPN